MAIDQATRASLELHVTQRGQRKGSLRQVIDLTVTHPARACCRRGWLHRCADAGAINERLDAVGVAGQYTMLTGRLRPTLKAVPDLARALTRLALDRGGPRDLAAIGVGRSAPRVGAHFDRSRRRCRPGSPAPSLGAAPLSSELALALDELPLAQSRWRLRAQGL